MTYNVTSGTVNHSRFFTASVIICVGIDLHKLLQKQYKIWNEVNICSALPKCREILTLKNMFLYIQNMKLGVVDVIPRGSLDSLTAEDLRLLLNGMGDISTQALIGYTSFNDESSKYLLLQTSSHNE